MPDTSHQERTFLFSALVYILKYIYARKVNFFGVFWRNMETKIKKYVKNVAIFRKIKNIEL